MSASIQQNRQFFRFVMLGLLVWGLFVALGAFLGPEFWAARTRDLASEPSKTYEMVPPSSDQPAKRALTASFDYRKPVIIMTSVGIFLGIWAALLYSRQKKLEREALGKS